MLWSPPNTLALSVLLLALPIAGCGAPPARSARRTALPDARPLALHTVAAVARRAAPAVVRIAVDRSLWPTDHPVGRAVGTGFVVSPAGVVVAPASLVSGADRITVHCAGFTKPLPVLKARVVGRVAVLRLASPRALPSLALRSGAPPAIGSFVLVLGPQSAEMGVVSAEQRLGAAAGGAAALLQTDAPIHAEEVGGPLVDLTGRVLGMAAGSVANIRGISFAVPATEVRLALRGAT